MCPPSALGLLLTGAGTAASAINRQQALRRQDRALAAGLRRQQQLQRQADQTLSEQTRAIAGSDGAAEREQALNEFLHALTRAQGESRLRRPAAASPRFAADVAGHDPGLREYGARQAGVQAVLAGALRQRENEARGQARAYDALTELARQSAAEDAITRLRVRERQPNPWIDALAGVATGAGSVLALRPPGLPRSNPLSRAYRRGTLIDPPRRITATRLS